VPVLYAIRIYGHLGALGPVCLPGAGPV